MTARRIRAFLSLSRSDRRAFLLAWAWLCTVRFGVTLLGPMRINRLLPPAPARDARRDDFPRAAGWLGVAARYVPGGASCLVRSLALLALLRRAGVAAELRIGIGNTRPGLEAHAWVEVDGRPVNDAADVATRYSAFAPPPLRSGTAP
jgi:hypothetical protein